jgi:glycogen operon protein
VNRNVTTGQSAPLGAALTHGGVNFCIYSRYASGVDLLFFDEEDDSHAARVVCLDPSVNRTYYYWHVFVPEVQPGQIYAYRLVGPFDPGSGQRFDSAKVLLDPYGRGTVVPKNYSREGACSPGNNAATAMKSVVIDTHAYDWEGDTPLKRPSSRTVVYEMHVRGFTRDPSSGVSDEKQGTYAGLIEKIPYLLVVCTSASGRWG